MFLTVFTLFFGELLPKALGVSNAELVARATVPAISVLAAFMSPFTLLCKHIINRILRTFGVSSDDEGKVSEEELRLIVMGAKQSGGIETGEAKMVEGVLDLQDMRICEVMKPRINVEALEANSTLADFLHLVNTTKYSRFPVYEGEIDHIVGVVIVKDLLGVEPSLYSTTKVRSLMEATYFVPESMRVQMVLEEMRRRRLHMAIVVDEYGGTAGVVTLEDIIEEVVGEIYDEGDSEVMCPFASIFVIKILVFDVLHFRRRRKFRILFFLLKMASSRSKAWRSWMTLKSHSAQHFIKKSLVTSGLFLVTSVTKQVKFRSRETFSSSTRRVRYFRCEGK